MHRNPHKKDKEATKARKFLSRFSYVSLRKHPGTEKNCEYLAGLVDTGVRRLEVFTRDGYKCVDCGNPVSWETGHMAHGGRTKVSRCDCLENLSTKCKACHGKNDHHGRF